MGKEVVTLHVTKTQTYYMDVQLDESINLEDLDRISFEYLVSQSTDEGEDSYETYWEEVGGEGNSNGEDILCLNESGEPYFKNSSNDE